MRFHEKRRLQQEARAAGLTLSELLRRRFLGRVVVAHTDLALIRELRSLAAAVRDSGGGDSGAAMMEEIRAALEALATRRLP